MISLSASADYGLSGQYIARITGRDSKYTFEREFIGRKGGKRNETSTADVDDPGLYECCDIDKKDGKTSRFFVVLEVDGELMSFEADKQDAMTVAKAISARREFSDIVVGFAADPEAAELWGRIKSLKKMQFKHRPMEYELAAERQITHPVGPHAIGTVLKQSELQPLLKEEIEPLEKQLAELEEAGKKKQAGYTILTEKQAEKKQAAQTVETAIAECWAILEPLPIKDAKKVMAAIKEKMNPPKPPAE